MTGFHDDAVLVDTHFGTVCGSHDGATLRWLGIPFAADPIGKLRFRAPQPPSSWTGVRDALEYGNIAPQVPTKLIPIPPGVKIAEDCLNLNVWAPSSDEAPQAGKRPVMVWVHGGAYFVGFSAQKMYNARNLCETSGALIVTVNYRLGALGFLDFSSFGDAEHQFDTNLGLRDIVAALNWVRDNIAAFGGDPDDVTLFGESAGGGCVTALMTSPHAEGLFHKAIAQSSPVTSVYGTERATSIARMYLSLIGIDPSKAKTKLRSMDAHDLAAPTLKLLNEVATTSPGAVAFAPVIDGDVLPEAPIDVFREGREMRIPLIIGTNHDETSLFKLMKSPLMPMHESTVQEMFDQVLAEKPDLAHIEGDITRAYPDYPKQKGAMEISRDAGFRMPSIWAAEAHSRVAPTWMYRFDQAPPLLRFLGIGASHAAELPYVFGTLPEKVRAVDIGFRFGGLKEAHAVSERVQAHWSAFAQTGDPQTATLPWPRYDETTRTTLLIDANDKVEDDPDAEVRKAWGEEPIGFS
ncbi:MAG: carboxylesterase/lipase family protein [Actinobacteria bacterium]|nr:carboxylesterase/lipase family protein [Actinomycetota bacterium]